MKSEEDPSSAAASADYAAINAAGLGRLAATYDVATAQRVLTNAQNIAGTRAPSAEQVRAAALQFADEVAEQLYCEHALTASAELRFEPVPIPRSSDTYGSKAAAPTK